MNSKLEAKCIGHCSKSSQKEITPTAAGIINTWVFFLPNTWGHQFYRAPFSPPIAHTFFNTLWAELGRTIAKYHWLIHWHRQLWTSCLHEGGGSLNCCCHWLAGKALVNSLFIIAPVQSKRRTEERQQRHLKKVEFKKNYKRSSCLKKTKQKKQQNGLGRNPFGGEGSLYSFLKWRSCLCNY